MKGPSGRLKYDALRQWECPVCRRRDRTDGAIVNRRCETCLKSSPSRLSWMRLVEETPRT